MHTDDRPPGPGCTRRRRRRPQPAAYSAGIGTEVGLLQSPTAVAITNPGTVLILEVPPARPTIRFRPGRQPDQVLRDEPRPVHPEAGHAGTYQDLAVDGLGQIYLLYYTGDGAARRLPHRRLYADGRAVGTQSPGVNVAKWRSTTSAASTRPTSIRYLEGTTTPRIDPALGVAEPMVSRFDPHSGGAV